MNFSDRISICDIPNLKTESVVFHVLQSVFYGAAGFCALILVALLAITHFMHIPGAVFRASIYNNGLLYLPYLLGSFICHMIPIDSSSLLDEKLSTTVLQIFFGKFFSLHQKNIAKIFLTLTVCY